MKPLAALLSSTVLAVCGNVAAGVTERFHIDHTDSLLRAHDHLSFALESQGPVDGFIPHVTADVAYLHPGQDIITGRDATREFLQSIYPQSRAVKTTLHRIVGQASADGTIGYTVGWIEEVATQDKTAPVTTFGRFIATWRRFDDEWRVQGFLRLASVHPLAPVPGDALILDGTTAVVQPGFPTAQRLEIALADSRFAGLSIDQGYTIAFSKYAMDESVVVDEKFLFNRAGVAEAWAGWTPNQLLSWYPLRTEAAATGDFGWSIGNAVFAFTTTDNVIRRSFSKYMTVWIRTAEGWRFLLDGGNDRPPP